jgi:hypothetical protein
MNELTELRPIAIATDYLTLVAALRKRVAELGINYETVDALAGWTDSYASKVLATEPLKRMGQMSLDAIIGALGVKLIVVEDPEQTAVITSRPAFQKRKVARPMLSSAWHDHIVHRKTRQDMRNMGVRGGLARAKIPPRKRIQLARRAARIRWSKPRIVEIAQPAEVTCR